MAKKSAGNFLRSSKLILVGIAAVLILVFFGSLQLLRGIYQTETYYVLNTEIPARTAITMDMLTPVVTSYGTAPGGASEASQADKEAERAQVLTAIQAGTIYSRYPLVSGDILSPSSVGGLDDISVGVPDNWVITSFSVNADNAVGGRIQRGFYFDMMVVSTGGEGAYYPFVNMLALDTSVSLDSASSNQAVDTEEADAGQTTQYTVAMDPANAARLQSIVNEGNTIKLVLSPRQNEYNAPQLAAYSGSFSYEGGVVAPGLSVSIENNERVFVEADNNGQPVVRDGGVVKLTREAIETGDVSVDASPDEIFDLESELESVSGVNAEGNSVTYIPLLREVTDYSFTDVERDDFGRPISQLDNIGLGNAKIPSGTTNEVESE